ncbi:MAG TPA: MotA/TolQ/ExbB proton channel family protein [Bdellovibrionales bacterium]|nr:MotA/TolQ/ExbB proton channel family protein [Bdellovibrionales bacterium]
MKLKAKVSLNVSFIIGLVAMTAVVLVATFHATTNLLLLLNFTAVIIVFGGVTASALVIQPVQALRHLGIKVYKYMRFEYDPSWRVAAGLVNAAIQYGQTKSFRRVGEVQNRRLFEALELVESGMRKEDIRAILETKRDSSISQSVSDAGLLLTLAKLAPGYGLVGTLIGLVVLLYDLGSGNFDKVGPAMALALLATLYGVLIANVIFMPLAEFISHRAETVAKMDDLMEKGVVAILEGRHPIQIREMLRAYLSSYEQDDFDAELQRLRDAETPVEQTGVTDMPEANVG